MEEKMYRAYQAAKHLLDETSSEEERELLGSMSETDVVVVRGSYDRVQNVLRIMGIPFLLVEPRDVAALSLRPEQMLVVNCPGHIGPKGVGVVRRFVEGGGMLFTTDWALKHVLEPAFPGYVAYNRRPTADDVVRIEIVDKEHSFLKDIFRDGSDPLWWLESSSYPIRVLKPDEVRVLLSSSELQQKYGEAPVAITFRYGAGEVFHMISHYYLQRTETRGARHKSSWKLYAQEIGAEGVAKADMPELDALTTSEVEAAYTSMAFVRRAMMMSRRMKQERDA